MAGALSDEYHVAVVWLSKEATTWLLFSSWGRDAMGLVLSEKCMVSLVLCH